MAVQPGLCWTCKETLKTGFLTTQLKLYISDPSFPQFVVPRVGTPSKNSYDATVTNGAVVNDPWSEN